VIATGTGFGRQLLVNGFNMTWLTPDNKYMVHLPLAIMQRHPQNAVAGYLTPLLVDAWSGGDPDRAGAAYAVSIVGSIVGPLVAGFWLLPRHSGRRRRHQ
jgi:hypothetical protein